MSRVSLKGTAYCLNYAAELGRHYGNTPHTERIEHGETDFLRNLPGAVPDYNASLAYPPNLAYTGSMTPGELESRPRPWRENPARPSRFGRFGEIMPEDEFIGLLDICDVFDLIWLEKSFAESVAPKLMNHPALLKSQAERVETGHDIGEIEREIAGSGALPIFFNDRVAACCRRGHETDPNLGAHVLLENLVCKAGGVLALMHLMKNAGIRPEDIDFILECSEEAVGDVSQRGGGNMAKAVAETAVCVNASGSDVRAFCAGPVDAIVMASSLIASGVMKNVAVVSGGSLQKLFMNAREHVKKNLPALECCLGNFAVLISPPDGTHPEIRLDSIGIHPVGAGSSPQAITTSLVFDPLEKLGLGFSDVDKYAPELQNPEITVPAGAGDVPESNYKMIAALAVMKKQLEKSEIPDFVKKHGVPGFAPTQGHIPSGVPFLGHAADAITSGSMTRCMIIGKGSLFLGRLTNLADGMSFIVEKPSARQSVSETAARKTRIALIAAGGEHVSDGDMGQGELLRGAMLAAARDSSTEVVMIGPKTSRAALDCGLQWIETGREEAEILSALESALDSRQVDGAVAMHYGFPIGVTTVGRVVTPCEGREMLIASTTGSSSTDLAEAMARNAISGIAVAKSLGMDKPSVGILNVNGAVSAERLLRKLADSGYEINFGVSARADGGSLLRGNDLLSGAVDLCVTDSLTGNMLMKLFSSWSSGGRYEAFGFGYGPSVGEGWNRVIAIVSRASGAPVIANAIAFARDTVRGGLIRHAEREFSLARSRGLTEIASRASEEKETTASPPAEPVGGEINGVDVLSVEEAARALRAGGIYAETYMGCTGPVIKVPIRHLNAAGGILRGAGYIA